MITTETVGIIMTHITLLDLLSRLEADKVLMVYTLANTWYTNKITPTMAYMFFCFCHWCEF